MAKIYPGEGMDRQRAVARVLLSIVGDDRAAEIETRSLPLHYEVPEDVAVEYERQLQAARDARAEREAQATEPAAEQPPTGDGAAQEPAADTPAEGEDSAAPATTTTRRTTRSTK